MRVQSCTRVSLALCLKLDKMPDPLRESHLLAMAGDDVACSHVVGKWTINSLLCLAE